MGCKETLLALELKPAADAAPPADVEKQREKLRELKELATQSDSETAA
jgi:hypothetical protein